MKILTYLPILLGLLLGSYTTNIFKKIQVKKIEKRFNRIVAEKNDSLVFLKNKMTDLQKSDSLKSEFLNQKDLVLSDLNKERNFLFKENKVLKAWKLDAIDGIITDTVKVKKKLFGGYKIVK